MPSLHNVEVSILVDGVALPELDVKLDPQSRKATCYIEAKDGKEFTVATRNTCGTLSSSRVWLDGEYVGGLVIREAQTGNLAGKRLTADTIKPFSFSKVRLSDVDEACCKDEEILKGLGRIKVEAKRIREIGTQPFGEWRTNEANKIFHENSKKAQLTHVASLGEVKRVAAVDSISFEWIDQAAYMTFEFAFLSRDLLEIKGLVEPLPPPQEEAKPVVKEETSGRSKTVVIDIDDDEPVRPRKRKGKPDRYEIDLTGPDMKAVKLEDAPVKEEDIVHLE